MSASNQSYMIIHFQVTTAQTLHLISPGQSISVPNLSSVLLQWEWHHDIWWLPRDGFCVQSKVQASKKDSVGFQVIRLKSILLLKMIDEWGYYYFILIQDFNDDDSIDYEDLDLILDILTGRTIEDDLKERIAKTVKIRFKLYKLYAVLSCKIILAVGRLIITIEPVFNIIMLPYNALLCLLCYHTMHIEPVFNIIMLPW